MQSNNHVVGLAGQANVGCGRLDKIGRRWWHCGGDDGDLAKIRQDLTRFDEVSPNHLSLIWVLINLVKLSFYISCLGQVTQHMYYVS
jgi:hypothetical protein